ncbi:MAG: hypothetical protein QW549_01635 [Candidatus Micrarchaeaceae archaeon]
MEITSILQLNDYIYIGTAVAFGILAAYAFAKEIAEQCSIKSLMRDRSISVNNLHEDIRKTYLQKKIRNFKR